MPTRDTSDSFESSRPPSARPTGTNYLLAIAINDYLHCSKLNNAVRDVEAFIELMTTRYHFDPIHVIFIKDAEATEKRIRRAFDRLIDVVTEQDNLIIYFSGHGRHHERRGGYWIPVEAGTGDDWVDYIPNSHIKDYLSKIKSFHTFLIADSCFSGSLFIDKSKEKFSGDRRDTEPSRWGLTSGKKEIVSDGHPGTHSPFSTALLETLKKVDTPIGVVSLCERVTEIVTANENQTPMYAALKVEGHNYGQYVFYLREDEEAAWQTALQANTRQAYSDFCDKYPRGKFIDEALAKIDSLEQKHEDIIHSKEFKNNILNLFYNYREEISQDLEKDLQKVKEANYGSYQYPENLKFQLIEYLQIYRYFSSLLNTIGSEEITLKSIDYFAFGIASLLQGKIGESKDFFESAVQTNPNDHIACFKLGTVCYELNDFNSAVSKFEDAINLEPNFAAAYYNLGMSFIQLGEQEKAITAFKEVIRIDTSYIDAYINLSAIYVLINELDRADSTLDLILDKNISSAPSLYYNKAYIYSLKKNKPETLSFLRKAIKLDPLSTFREKVKGDEAFQWLFDSEEFISIINQGHSYHLPPNLDPKIHPPSTKKDPKSGESFSALPGSGPLKNKNPDPYP